MRPRKEEEGRRRIRIELTLDPQTLLALDSLAEYLAMSRSAVVDQSVLELAIRFRKAMGREHETGG